MNVTTRIFTSTSWASRQGTLECVLGSRIFWGAALAMAGAALLNAESSTFIQNAFADRPLVPDLLFRILPYLPQTQGLTDMADVLSPLLVISHLLGKESRIRTLPYVVATFAAAYALRGCLVILTPLGGPLGNMATYGLTSVHQHGQFPSGHTIMVALSYLLVNRKANPLLKNALLALVALEVISLLLSHGHYSIDIVGGLFVAYFCQREMSPYQKRLTVPAR